MKKNENHPHFQLLVLITTPKLADCAAEVFKCGALPIQYRFAAKGSPSNEMMEIFGLGTIDKSVLLSVIPEPFAETMLDKLRVQLHLNSLKNGIAFTVNITSANNFIRQLSAEEHNKQNVERIEKNMSDNKYSLISIITNSGFSSEIMDTAKTSGATDGTVIQGKRIGNEDVNSFWGITVQEEKEVILIVSKKENTEKITNLSHYLGSD